MDLDFNTEPVVPTEAKSTSNGDRSHRRTTACTTFSKQYLYRRGFSEARLLEAMRLEQLQKGQCWHFITAGDVDSLSFLKVVLLHQPKLHYLLFSTWCMAAEDILQFGEWIDQGVIEKLDCYVGEIFPNQYRVEWRMLNELVERVAEMKAKSKALLVQQVSKQYADQIANLEKRITKQEKDFKEERAGYVEREKRNVEEMADMKGKVKWMASKLNEQKRKIIWLSIGLVLALALAVYLMVR